MRMRFDTGTQNPGGLGLNELLCSSPCRQTFLVFYRTMMAELEKAVRKIPPGKQRDSIEVCVCVCVPGFVCSFVRGHLLVCLANVSVLFCCVWSIFFQWAPVSLLSRGSYCTVQGWSVQSPLPAYLICFCTTYHQLISSMPRVILPYS